MPTILTATDFSEIANNAVQYACKLACTQGALLKVLHTYMVPVSFNENPMPIMPIDESKEIAEEQMSELKKSLQQEFPDLNISSKIVYGDIIENLKEKADEEKPMLIVVGNTSSENEGIWLGSSLMSTLRHMTSPVMAVPPNCNYKAIKKIGFACDYKVADKKLPTEDLLQLVKRHEASLHVLHVDHDNKSFDTETPLHSEQLHNALSSASPEYHYIDNKDTAQGIQAFVESNDIDMLIVVPHKYSLLDGLFHKSLTKAIIKLSHIPVIALHDVSE